MLLTWFGWGSSPHGATRIMSGVLSEIHEKEACVLRPLQMDFCLSHFHFDLVHPVVCDFTAKDLTNSSLKLGQESPKPPWGPLPA